LPHAYGFDTQGGALPVQPLSGKLCAGCELPQGASDVLHLRCGMPTRLRLLPLLLAFAPLASALADDAPAPAVTGVADNTSDVPPICPVGVLVCPKPKNKYVGCKRNDLLDFYTPGLPGAGDRAQAPTDVVARKVTQADATHDRLEGDVELSKLDALLKADVVTYDRETTDYTATGNVRFQDHATLLSADSAHGTGSPNSTYLDDVHYQLLEQRGNGIAAKANQTDPDHSQAFDATYSTCDPTDRKWEIRARELDMDHVEEKGRAHDATLVYDGVPFFWFPYLSFPLDNERSSGFLLPHVGYSERRGLVLGFPYYFNLAPNYDATLAPRVMTERGAMLEGQFRYLSSSSKLELDFNYMPHDRQADEEYRDYLATQPPGTFVPTIPDSRNFLRLNDITSFSSNWGAVISINHVSDANYLRDFGNSFVTTATALLPSSAYLNGHGDWWSATFGGDSWEITDPTLSDAFEPYRRLPRATFVGEHSVIGSLVAGVNAEYADFSKDNAVTGGRVDIYPYVALPLETAAYFIRPELGLRYTGYDLSHLDKYATTQPGALPLTEDSPSRSTPIFSLDSGLVFERATELFGDNFTQTLEPRLFYLRVPYRNQNDLPIFDTQLPTFDFPSLFRTNTFVGADRQTSANNLTAALTTRLINSDSGDQLLSASIGEIHYFDTQKVQLPGYPELDYSGSDYVGQLELRLNDRWDLRWDQQWNPNTHETDLSGVGVEYRFGAEGVVNVSYRFRRNFLEQVDTSALFPLNDRWSLIGRYYYSLMDSRLLEAFGGFEYDSCCVAARFLVRHYVNIVGASTADTAVYFELEFKGVGSSGTRTENYLRRTMLGYP
jgi:LPS-assembly protein